MKEKIKIEKIEYGNIPREEIILKLFVKWVNENKDISIKLK